MVACARVCVCHVCGVSVVRWEVRTKSVDHVSRLALPCQPLPVLQVMLPQEPLPSALAAGATERLDVELFEARVDHEHEHQVRDDAERSCQNQKRNVCLRSDRR